jgi:hypothetical protein
MKTIEMTIKGSAPLLMNSNQGVNPLHPLTRKMKVLTAKRKRTEEDDLEILHLKWTLGLYWRDDIGVHVPSVNLEAMFRNAAKTVRKGTIAKQQSAITVKPDFIPLTYPENPKVPDDLWNDPNNRYSDVKVGKIKQASVLLCRPRFDNWALTFKISFDETKFEQQEVIDLFALAGREVGLCDYRGKYGMYEIVEVK